MQQSNRHAWLWALVGLLTVGAALSPALARKRRKKPVLVIVGKVKHTTNPKLGDRKLMVRVGDRDWVLHVQNNARVAHGKKLISVHRIDLGTWVKATGPQIGEQRQRTDRLDVIGTHGAYLRSRVYKKSKPNGYIIRRR